MTAMEQDAPPIPERADSQLFGSYPKLQRHYDELWENPHRPRAHWEHFLHALNALGVEELEKRRQEARRQILDNGVSYTVYGDPQGLDRPWELDPIPVLIDSHEWAYTESGLIQRAELLNLILQDIYGPRELIRKRLLPQEIVFRHSGFLRTCAHLLQPARHLLILYAADLVRAEDGRFYVIDDRTQAPSGAGYALENRIVTSRVLPSLFRDSQVHRLALFFRTLRMTLSSIAPARQDNPNIAILSPGPLNETYFEHAYLANYLGYPLVQGSDLTVRGNRVWLKSLDGLQPVDVILRRVDDHWCDPVELREDSQIGVAGLMQAVRAGNVALANPLGSGVLENPGLMPFLPAIAKHFLGKDLLLPSVKTWWCGHPDHLKWVLSRFDDLVIKTISPSYSTGARVRFSAQLDRDQKQALLAQIKADPALYVAQERLSPSTAPAFLDGGLHPKPSVLRGFAIAREDAYVIMPGGLMRIAPRDDQWLISNQTGGISKDTWVLASEPEKQITLWLKTEDAAPFNQSQGSLSSRIAENLYWLGRYAERSEGLIRQARTVIVKWLDSCGAEDLAEQEICQGLTRVIQGLLRTTQNYSRSQAEAQLLALIQRAPSTPNGLSFNLNAMIQSAHSVRERLSSDTWHAINAIREQLFDLRQKNPLQLDDSLEKLDALITALMAFSGLTMESLSRDQDWLFLDLGRRIERSQNLTARLRHCLLRPCSETSETTVLEALLCGAESLIAYRRRFRAQLHIQNVLDLLLLDERHPRSLAYQFGLIQRYIEDLPSKTDQHHLSREARLILEANTRLRLADLPDLGLSSLLTGEREELGALLADLHQLLINLADTLSEDYLTHVLPARQLAPLRKDISPSTTP